MQIELLEIRDHLNRYPPFDTLPEDSLDTIIPASASMPYDMHEVIRKTVDEGDFFEISPQFGGNIICAMASTCGVITAAPAPCSDNCPCRPWLIVSLALPELATRNLGSVELRRSPYQSVPPEAGWLIGNCTR
mgnify:CR=1 FL=1